MKLGYLGPQGSYSYEAARAYAPSDEHKPMASFYEIIQAVEKENIDEGILPIENSIEGTVTFVLDGLLRIEKAQIIRELVFPIYHNLVSLNNNIEEINCIYSHPRAIEQCRGYFKRSIPEAILIPCESTSLACASAKRKGKNFAAIANMESSMIYGLNILESNIQDNFLNQTRFIIIGREPVSECHHCKVSIAFTFPDDSPGTLYKVLKVFADKNINLTRIESRPAKTEIGNYVFYIDFIEASKDDTMYKALHEIKSLTASLKILGIYPAYLI
ncbi:MAG TPA: prephenate dehydratase [Oscillospiraceae bacterium]|nr:prephenate dehydratase [Oscillospiraceae bacterium]